MAAIDWQKLKQDATETIQGIDANELTQSTYILLGSSIAILNHKEFDEMNMPPTQKKPIQANVMESKTTSGVLDDFSIILSKYNDSRISVDREEMRRVLKQQLADIERELIEMRMEVHDPECVKMFIEFRENLKMNI